MLLRIFNDDSPLVDHSQIRKQALEAAKDSPSPDAAGQTDTAMADPETYVDEEDGGVKLNADVDEDIENADATAPIGESGVGTEEDALATEDRLRAEQQTIADEDQKVAAAPEREGEDDSFNKTV